MTVRTPISIGGENETTCPLRPADYAVPNVRLAEIALNLPDHPILACIRRTSP